MKMATIQNKGTSGFLSYFSLFSSVGTLLCCALPSVLVLAGLGTSVASMLSALPWLVALSHHKIWTFVTSGVLMGASFVNMYWFAPRLRARSCSPENRGACEEASRLSKMALWFSAILYATGFFVAFVLGPILARLDRL
jgi:mercuric ion transport protein